MSQENQTSTPPPLGINQRQTAAESIRLEPTYHGAASLGALLRDARQKHGLSPADLAGSLNLDLAIVEAIESNRLDEAPEPMYIRAYLKHWAGMMAVDPAPWLAALDAQTNTLPTAPRVSARTPIDAVRPARLTGGHRRGGFAAAFWRLLVVLVLLGAAVALIALALPSFWQKVMQWLPGHEPINTADSSLALPITPVPLHNTPPAAPTSPAPNLPPPPSLTLPNTPTAPATSANSGVDAQQTNTDVITTPDAPTTEPAPAEPSAAATNPTTPPTTTPPAASANTQNTLKIAVTSADCWVEVRDANGKRLIYDVLKKGSERSLTGNPPFTIVLGHANGVEVTWQNKPITLPAPNSTTGIIRTTVGGS